MNTRYLALALTIGVACGSGGSSGRPTNSPEPWSSAFPLIAPSPNPTRYPPAEIAHAAAQLLASGDGGILGAYKTGVAAEMGCFVDFWLASYPTRERDLVERRKQALEAELLKTYASDQIGEATERVTYPLRTTADGKHVRADWVTAVAVVQCQ